MHFTSQIGVNWVVDAFENLTNSQHLYAPKCL